MKKIYLTNEQVLQILKESIVTEKDMNSFAQKKVGDVITHLQKRAKGGDSRLIQNAKENGINIQSLKGELSNDEYNANVQSQVEELIKEKNNIINGWVKKYLPILRAQYKNSNGIDTKNFNIGKDSVDMVGGMPQRDSNGDIIVKNDLGSFDFLDDDVKAQVYAVREFLDKEGLTFLYRKATKQSSVKMRYNIDYNEDIDWTTPVNEINIDFGQLSSGELADYYNGTRIKWINEKLRELGYNIGDKERVNKDSESYEDFKNIATEGKLRMVAERYVQRKYGMNFTFGSKNKMFSFGNKKINDDTLIVNFTAAMRCPAWNECLLKDACYARNTERGYDNALNKNLKTNLIWEQTREDSELMNLMAQLIRATMLDYSGLVKYLKSPKPKETIYPMDKNGQYRLWEAKKKGIDVTEDELCAKTLAEIRDTYGEDAIEWLSENRLGNLIRLNEDGDFIGQWLVDAWDKWAGDFKIVGINVAAYTCRALNYEKVKNIILNISQENLVAGQTSKAFAHFFYAVTPDIYDRLNETYNGKDFQLNIDEKSGRITPIYRNLIDEDGNLQGYYYKCPCGRGKYKYVPVEYNEIPLKKRNLIQMGSKTLDARDDSPEYMTVGDKYYKRIKNTNIAEKADCYRCRICYGRDEEEDVVTENGLKPNPNLPVYVLVSAHGANKDEFSVKRGIAGKKVEDWVALQEKGNMNQMPIGKSVATLSENIVSNENDPIAIEQITKNTVESVANMMRGKINGTNAINEIKKEFNNFYKRLLK